jgi:hypothetical protein
LLILSQITSSQTVPAFTFEVLVSPSIYNTPYYGLRWENESGQRINDVSMAINLSYDFASPKAFAWTPYTFIELMNCEYDQCVYDADGVCTESTSPFDVVFGASSLYEASLPVLGLNAIRCDLVNAVGPIQLLVDMVVKQTPDLQSEDGTPISASYAWMAPFLTTRLPRPLVSINTATLVSTGVFELSLYGLDHHNVLGLFFSICPSIGSINTSVTPTLKTIGGISRGNAVFSTTNSPSIPFPSGSCYLIEFPRLTDTALKLTLTLTGILQTDIDTGYFMLKMAFFPRFSGNALPNHFTEVFSVAPQPTTPVPYITGNPFTMDYTSPFSPSVLTFTIPSQSRYSFQFAHPRLANMILPVSCGPNVAESSVVSYSPILNQILTDTTSGDDVLKCKIFISSFLIGFPAYMSPTFTASQYSIFLRGSTMFGGELPGETVNGLYGTLLGGTPYAASFHDVKTTSFFPTSTTSTTATYPGQISLTIPGLIMFADLDIVLPHEIKFPSLPSSIAYPTTFASIDGTIRTGTLRATIVASGSTYGDCTNLSGVSSPCPVARLQLSSATLEYVDQGSTVFETSLPPHTSRLITNLPVEITTGKPLPTSFSSTPLGSGSDFPATKQVKFNWIFYSPHSYIPYSDLHQKVTNNVYSQTDTVIPTVTMPSDIFLPALLTTSTQTFSFSARRPPISFSPAPTSQWKSTMLWAYGNGKFVINLGTCSGSFLFGSTGFANNLGVAPTITTTKITYDFSAGNSSTDPALITELGKFRLVYQGGTFSAFTSCELNAVFTPQGSSSSITYSLLVAAPPVDPPFVHPAMSLKSPTFDILSSSLPINLPEVVIPIADETLDPQNYPVIRLSNGSVIDVEIDVKEITDLTKLKLDLIYTTKAGSTTQEILLDTVDYNPTANTIVKHSFQFKKNVRGNNSFAIRLTYSYQSLPYTQTSIPFSIMLICMAPSNGLTNPWQSLCGGVNGKCIGTNNGGECQCDVQYQGSFCQTQIPNLTEHYCPQCKLDNVDKCILPATTSELGTCQCKSGFAGSDCSQSKSCINTSASTCNYPNGQLMTTSNGSCGTDCQCNLFWASGKFGNCSICALQCSNQGIAFKKCDKCGCRAGFAGDKCQCISKQAILLLRGFNVYLEMFFDFENGQIGQEDSTFDYETMMFNRDILLNDIRQDIWDEFGMEITIDINSLQGQAPSETKSTKFTLDFLYQCPEHNPQISTDILQTKFEQFSSQFLNSKSLLKHFIFEKTENSQPILKTDLVDGVDTLPDDDDRYTDNSGQSGVSRIGPFFAIIIVFVAVILG